MVVKIKAVALFAAARFCPGFTKARYSCRLGNEVECAIGWQSGRFIARFERLA